MIENREEGGLISRSALVSMGATVISYAAIQLLWKSNLAFPASIVAGTASRRLYEKYSDPSTLRDAGEPIVQDPQ